jgi:uncharacterized protein with PQ loop repeat
MNIRSILGTLGMVIVLVRAMPQLVKLLRSREAYGVSVDSAASGSVVSLGWATYGVLTNQPYLSCASGPAGIIFAIITVLALRFGRQTREFKIAPVWFGVLVLAGAIGGKNGLGMVLPISVLVINIPQLGVAYKEDNLTDLSLGTWLLCVADGLTWGGYSLIQHDISIMAGSFFQLTTSVLIVALKLANKAKLRKQGSFPQGLDFCNK